MQYDTGYPDPTEQHILSGDVLAPGEPGYTSPSLLEQELMRAEQQTLRNVAEFIVSTQKILANANPLRYGGSILAVVCTLWTAAGVSEVASGEIPAEDLSIPGAIALTGVAMAVWGAKLKRRYQARIDKDWYQEAWGREYR